MNTLKAFWASHSISVHSVALAIAFCMGGYAEVPAFHALVDALVAHLPHGLVAAGIALWQLWLWYNGRPGPGLGATLAKVAGVGALLAVLTLGLAGCPKDKTVAAAGAVQKYAQALEGLQQAEIAAHHDGAIGDALHKKIEADVAKAAQAGEDLDTGIVAAAGGASPQAYIDAAYTSSNALIDDLNLVPDPKKRAELQLLFKSSRDILETSLALFLK